MDYIVNPWIFYWLEVVNVLKIVAGILGVFAFVCVIVGIVMKYDNISYGPEDHDYKNGVKLLRVFTPILITMALLLIFIPGKNTMIQMLIARYATKTNINLGLDAIKEATDYIIQAIKEVK